MLNAAIVGIAWCGRGAILNLLGFAFTFGIGTVWGVFEYYAGRSSPAPQPFLLLFFAFYLLIPILYARRQPAGRRDLIDGCLVFGTPLVAFSLQAGLLMDDDAAHGAGVVRARAGRAVRRAGVVAASAANGYDVLAQSHALLAVGFATLAVPLALVGAARRPACSRWKARRWLAGPAPAATGCRSSPARACSWPRRWPSFIGMTAPGSPAGADAVPIANAAFMGALLIALAGFASAWAYRSAQNDNIAALYYLWGLAWWVGNGAARDLAASSAIATSPMRCSLSPR